jgi:16S rRNA (guanine(1405)-N(7))-methyltransferase
VASTGEEKQLDQLLEAVLKSRKYRTVCEDLIRKIGTRELSTEQNLKAAIKSTKNKLHQISGAYFLTKPKYEVWLEKLRGAKNSGNDGLFRKTCAEIMRYHSSTRDRLDILDEFYARIFALLPPVNLIMDVACGFHPLAIPWMPLPRNVEYYAYDVYTDLIDFLNEFISMVDVRGCAEARDVTQHIPDAKADLAYVLNTVPCLEQIEKSAGLTVLESLDADFVLVSFPVRSLCGKEKSMREHYENMFNKTTEKKNWSIRKLEFAPELVFLIAKNETKQTP